MKQIFKVLNRLNDDDDAAVSTLENHRENDVVYRSNTLSGIILYGNLTSSLALPQ